MSEPKIDGFELKPGFKGMASDTASDQTMFKGVHWGKAMMWIFLLSDTFVFIKTKVSLNRKIHIIALPQCTPLNIVWSDAVSDAIPLNPGLSSKPSIFGSDIYFSYVFSTSVCITSLGAVVCGI